MKDHSAPKSAEAGSLEMEQYLKEHVSNNRSQIEDLQSSIEEFQSKIEDLEQVKDSNEELEDEISKFGEELKLTSQTLSDKIDDIQSQMDELEEQLEKKDSSGSNAEIDELTGKEIENKIEKKIQEKSINELNKIQKLESRVDDLEDRVNVEELETLDTIKETSGKGSENSSSSKKKSNKSGGSEILTPADVSEDMEGQEVKIKGELEFRKESSGNKFYKLEGSGKQIIVRSKSSIPEGRRILNGEVELVKGNICVFVQE